MDISVNAEELAFAENLRKYRDREFPGWGGMGCFAKTIGVSQYVLSQWMSGKQTPSIAQIHAVAKALGVDAVELCRPQTPEAGTEGDVPEIVQGQIAAIDTLILMLTHSKRALLGETDAKRHREGVRIIRELLESELKDR